MAKKLLLLTVCLAANLNAVIKTTKIADFQHQLNTDTAHKKSYINKTGKKLWFRYRVVNPKTGEFRGQEPILLPDATIDVDFAYLGEQILPAGYGKVAIFHEVGNVTRNPYKKMDELCVSRFKNGKKDLLISRHEFDNNDRFELYIDSNGRIACKSFKYLE
jgi:hypothetical protein